MVFLGRNIVTTVAGVTINSGLRQSLQVQRPADSTQSTGRLVVYNLSEGVERSIDKGTPIVIEAGYGNTAGVVFDGLVTRANAYRSTGGSPSRRLVMRLGDIVRGPPRLGGVTCRTYAGAVRLRQVFGDLAADLDLPVGPLDAIPEGATVRDFTWSGPTVGGLTAVCDIANSVWYEEDRLLRVRERARPSQSDAPVVVMSGVAGLIGSVAVTDEGARLVSHLNPNIRRGSLVPVVTGDVSGEWLVASLSHVADNWDGAFDTAAELRAA